MAGTRADNVDGGDLLLRPGETFGGYQIHELLGSGGFGQVFKATKLDVARPCALKVLHPDKAKLAEFVVRFRQESKAPGLINHNNVVDVWECGTLRTDNHELQYLVMDWLEGMTLREFLLPALGADPPAWPELRQLWAQRLPGQVMARLPVPQAIQHLLPVLSAVSAGHSRGIIHRDLKPENVFLCCRKGADLTVKVLDYGIAKISGPHQEQVTATRAVMGTPSFMAPELFYGAALATPASDQYALGAILYECLTGRPIADCADELARGRLGWPDRAGKRPAEVFDVVCKMLSQRPADRFPDLDEAARRLLPFNNPQAERRLQRAVLGSAGAFLLAAGVAVWIRSEVSMTGPPSEERAPIPVPAPAPPGSIDEQPIPQAPAPAARANPDNVPQSTRPKRQRTRPDLTRNAKAPGLPPVESRPTAVTASTESHPTAAPLTTQEQPLPPPAPATVAPGVPAESMIPPSAAVPR